MKTYKQTGSSSIHEFYYLFILGCFIISMAPALRCQARASLNEQKMCSERAEKMADRWRQSAVSLVNKNAEVYQANHFQGGRCLVAIEQYVPQDSRMVRIIDAFENNAVGDYLEMYNAPPKPDRISVCEVGHTKCSSLSEFHHLIHQKFGFAEEGQ